jgi:hypothetical protein
MSRVIGELEELTLLAVCILDGSAYGVSVKKEVERHTGRAILLGAIHITLYRLQDKACLIPGLAGVLKKEAIDASDSSAITKKEWNSYGLRRKYVKRCGD